MREPRKDCETTVGSRNGPVGYHPPGGGTRRPLLIAPTPPGSRRSSPAPRGGGSAWGYPVGSRVREGLWTRFSPGHVPIQWTVVGIAPRGGPGRGETLIGANATMGALHSWRYRRVSTFAESQSIVLKPGSDEARCRMPDLDCSPAHPNRGPWWESLWGLETGEGARPLPAGGYLKPPPGEKVHIDPSQPCPISTRGRTSPTSNLTTA